MFFAQITDTHITVRSSSLFKGRCPSKQLRNIISYLNTLPLDFVFLSGDCVHDGKPAEYELLREILNELKAPYYLIGGNHDDRRLLRQTFPSIDARCEDNEFIQFAIDTYPVRLVAADTNRHSSSVGEYCAERLAWLDKTLSAAPHQPTVLIMHHPPINTGIALLDKYKNQDGPQLGSLLEKHPQVKHILCGHFHRPVQSLFHGIPISIVPSAVAQFALEYNENATKLGITDEPPGFALHQWHETHLLTQFGSLPTVD